MSRHHRKIDMFLGGPIQNSVVFGGIRSVLANLECEPGFDLFGEVVCYRAIEVGQNLHCQLGFDPAIVDQVIDSVNERQADAALISQPSSGSRTKIESDGERTEIKSNLPQQYWANPPTATVEFVILLCCCRHRFVSSRSTVRNGAQGKEIALLQCDKRIRVGSE